MNPMNKTRTLSFRLAEDDYQKLVERCRVSELSQSKYLRYLIRIPMLAEAAKGEIPDASSSTGRRCARCRGSSRAGATTTTRPCMP